MVHPDSSRSRTGCFLDWTWGLGGFAALVLAGVLILKEHAWTITVKDAVYWGIVAAMLAARFASERRQPAPGVRRFAAALILLAGLGWIVVQSFRV